MMQIHEKEKLIGTKALKETNTPTVPMSSKYAAHSSTANRPDLKCRK